MSKLRKNDVSRIAITLAILLSGLLLVPYISLPTAAIGWSLFAGVYTPELAVNASSGAPGSTFTFTGTNYPPNSLATVYVDGEDLGTVTTDGAGAATFLLETTGAIPGLYNVTMEVDINASATQSIELLDGGALIPPPDNFPGSIFSIGHPIFLPVIFR